MACEFKLKRTVEFVETDMAGIMHFSNYFRFMEATEHAFFRSLGLTLHAGGDGGMHGWARVQASCDYGYPVRYQDVVEVHLTVTEKKKSSLGYDFVFRTVDPQGEKVRVVAHGSLKVVCVERKPGEERMRAVPMPEEVSLAVEVASQGT